MYELNNMTKNGIEEYGEKFHGINIDKQKTKKTLISDMILYEKDKFSIGNTVKIIKDHKLFSSKQGKIIEISEEFIEQDEKDKFYQKFLVQGKGLKGAMKKDKYNNYEAIDNARWYYAQQLELAIYKTKDTEEP